MLYKERYLFIDVAKEVYELCKGFLLPRRLSYFHFRRNYKDGSSLILASHGGFMKDFLYSDCKDVSYPPPTSIHQSYAYFWDECMDEELLTITREKNKLYHGVTIVNSYKEYYDCVDFAMSGFHSSPFSYYLNIIPNLKAYSEIFPEIAKPLMMKINFERIHAPQKESENRKFLFLPQKSKKIYIGPQNGNYITTYELLCMQLARERKTYKQIGSILSMSARTVETHLARLKSRLNLTNYGLFIKNLKISHLNNNYLWA